MSKIIFIIIISLSTISCSNDAKDSALTVNSSGNNYVNKFFGISVVKPEGWYAQSATETILLQQKGASIIANDDKNMEALIEAAMESSVPVFGFFEYPPGTPGKLNANILSIAENIKVYPGIKNGCDYIALVKDLLAKSKLKYELSEKCLSKNISGKEFGYIDAFTIIGEQKVQQRYFANVSKGYAFSIVQTFYDDESRKKVISVLSTVSFKNN